MSLPITAIIIAKNEEDHIVDCIRSVRHLCNEVLVLDNGSSDDTAMVAISQGAEVRSVEWQGYGPTKNQGHQLARYDWILSIDADEVVSPELSQSIKNLNLQDANIVYYVNRLTKYIDQWIKHSGWHPDWIPRIYHRDVAAWSDKKVHEELSFAKHIHKHKISGLLYHYSYESKEQYLEKIERYARLKAESWIENNQPPSLLKRWFGGLFKYWKSYYIQRGYKDGQAGKEIARFKKMLEKRQIEIYDQLKQSSRS